MKFSLPFLAFAIAMGGCKSSPPARSASSGAPGVPQAMHGHLNVDPLDKRILLPLLPHMAAHQKANMRGHLVAIQEILAALSTNDFAGVERAASHIGYSEQMGRMCAHMGTGAAGFTEMALHFHRTADTIGAAAKRRDANASLKAVAATVQTCVGCHATYRQQIVDEDTWDRIEAGIGKASSTRTDKP